VQWIRAVNSPHKHPLHLSIFFASELTVLPYFFCSPQPFSYSYTCFHRLGIAFLPFFAPITPPSLPPPPPFDSSLLFPSFILHTPRQAQFTKTEMFKSVADRLGIPHSSSSSSFSSHHSSSTSSPSPQHHRTSIFSSTPSSRSPSRQQQQHHGRSAAATAGSGTGTGAGLTAPAAASASGRTTPAATRKSSLSTPTQKPVLPPLSFFRDNHNNNLALSVADAGAHPDDPPSRAAENVTVSVRVRPFSLAEMKVAAGGPAEVWTVHEDSRIGYADDYSMRERRTAVDYTYGKFVKGVP
jgi:hypothetical protein